MTSIDFHFNVADKSGLIATLVQQAISRRQRVTITLENEKMAAELSRNLWQNVQTSFLPHVVAQHQQASQTPVLLHWGKAEFLQDELLINLSAQQPGAFSRFKHLIEVVGLDEQDKVAARARYKFYRDRGYAIRHVDNMNGKN